MSKYTTQLRWIVEQMGQGLEVPDGQEYADAVYKYIGLSKYPIFDETYRPKLNDKIIDHFFFKEIGFETAAQFAFYMRRTMNEIMPKYNALYRAQLTMDSEHPLSDFTSHRVEDWEAHVDDNGTRSVNTSVDETAQGTTSGTSQTSTTDHNRNVYQDTPMSLLSNEGDPSIEDLDYATNVTYDDGNGTTSGTTSGTSSETRGTETETGETSTRDRDDVGTRTHDEYGTRRSWAALMEEFAEKWQNIDMMVIADLEDLFLGLW